MIILHWGNGTAFSVKISEINAFVQETNGVMMHVGPKNEEALVPLRETLLAATARYNRAVRSFWR